MLYLAAVLGIIALVIAFVSGRIWDEVKSLASVLWMLALLFSAGAAIGLYSQTLGHVSSDTERGYDPLSQGESYRVRASYETKLGEDAIVLLEEDGTGNFYALRVKSIAPEHFVLVDDVPVALRD